MGPLPQSAHLARNLGRLWLAYIELQVEFYMLQLDKYKDVGMP